ncbi:MAG: hypothetical protein ABEJ96_09900, partial [Thiohalorhabdaceae bacterium]
MAGHHLRVPESTPKEQGDQGGARADHGDHDTAFPTLGDLLTGRAAGRRHDSEVVYFDNRAAGIQFAAVGDLVYERARERDLGVEIPLSWFQQTT